MSSGLEIDLHLVDGTVQSFRQSDPAKAQTVLSRLHPDRVFTGEVLVLAGSERVVTVRQRAVARVAIRGAIPADWGFGPGFDGIQVAGSGPRPERAEVPDRVGEPYTAHLELRDVAGGDLALTVHGRIMPEAVRAHRLERLLQGSCLHATAPGGALLVNLANVAALTVHGDVPTPTNALEVEPC